mmetsp:Transcript_106174/g.305275  ORF Transcript_106174/g.305275 Transcript_106174/m.305275 type:complete len:201 (+) Transcript_106174:501-1103(+)
MSEPLMSNQHHAPLFASESTPGACRDLKGVKGVARGDPAEALWRKRGESVAARASPFCPIREGGRRVTSRGMREEPMAPRADAFAVAKASRRWFTFSAACCASAPGFPIKAQLAAKLVAAWKNWTKAATKPMMTAAHSAGTLAAAAQSEAKLAKNAPTFQKDAARPRTSVAQRFALLLPSSCPGLQSSTASAICKAPWVK